MPATKTKLPKDALVSEILDAASKARSNAKKIEILQEFDSPALRAVLIWNFDDSARSMLPEGDVPYSPNEAPKGTDHNRLTSEYKNLYHFVKGGNDSLHLCVVRVCSFNFWNVFMLRKLRSSVLPKIRSCLISTH